MTSMYAQPQFASTYVAPQTYAAAPTMTSMYATPAASMYQPVGVAAPGNTTVVETVAAPATVVETVAAPQTTSTIVAAPVTMAAPQVVQPQLPGFSIPPPQKLTTNMVQPAVLEQEKLAFGKALDAQLKKQMDATLEEAKIKKEMLQQQAKTQLAQFQLQMEEQLQMAMLQVDQEASQMCAGLQEAAVTQQTQRDEQTAIQIADFTKKQALEVANQKTWELQKQWFEKETALEREYEAVMKKGLAKGINTPATAVIPSFQGPAGQVV